MASIIAKLQLKDGSELELDKSWLKSLNIKRQSNTQVGSIFYGVVPAQGTVDVIDKDGSIVKHIQDGLLDNNGAKINIYFNNKIIGRLVSSSSKYDDKNNVLSIECTDELNWLFNINYPYRQLTSDRRIYDLFIEVLGKAGYTTEQVNDMLSLPITRYGFVAVDDIKDLASYYFAYMPYLNSGMLSDQLNKLCNILQVSLAQIDGKSRFIDMSLDYNPNLNYINIPFKNQFSFADISLFKDNKVGSVIIDSKKLSSVHNSKIATENIKVYKESENINIFNSDNNPQQYIYKNTEDVINEGGELQIMGLYDSYLKFEIPDIILTPVNCISNTENIHLYFSMDIQYNRDLLHVSYRTRKLTWETEFTPTVKHWARWTQDVEIIEDNSDNGPDKIRKVMPTNRDPVYAKLILTPIDTNDGQVHCKATIYFIGSASTDADRDYFYAVNEISGFTINIEKEDFEASEYIKDDIPDAYHYASNELMTYNSFEKDENGKDITNLINQLVGEGNDGDVMTYILNSLTNTYKDGLYTCKITVDCGDYYDENGNKIKDASQGQLIELNDTIRIDHKKDLFNNMLWRVTGVNFRYDGRPLIDLELVEMRIEKPSVKIINGNYHVHSSIGELDGDIYFIGYMGTLENQHHELIKYEPDKDLLSSLLVLNDNYLNANDFYNVIDRCKYLSSDGNMKSCLINFGTEYAYIISKDNDSVYANYYNEKLPYRDLYYIPKPPLNLEGATITNVKNDYYIQLQTERSEHAAISEIRHTRSVPISTLYGDYSTKVFWASEKASSEYVLFCRDGIGYLESDDKLYVVKYSGNSEPQIQESTIEEFFNLDPMFAVLFNVYVDNDDNANSLYKGGQNLIVIADRDIFYIVEYDEFFANKTLHKYENPTIDGVKQIVVGIAKIGDWYFVACHNKTFADDYPIQILYGKSLDKLEFLGSALKGRTTAYSYPVEFKLINDYLYVVDPYGSNRPDLHDELAAIRIPPYIKKVDKNT